MDFLTLVVAVLSLSVIVSGFATMIKSPEVTDKVFREMFAVSIVSFGSSYLLLRAIKYLLSFKITLPDWPFSPIWFLTIVSGTFLFTYFTFESRFFGSLKVFTGFGLVALIPAALFRLAVNFLDAYWEERNVPTNLSILR